MDTLTSRALAAHLLLTGLLLDRVAQLRGDRGQASTEYAGVLFVIGAIITVVVGAMTTDIGTAIKDKIVEAIEGIGAAA